MTFNSKSTDRPNIFHSYCRKINLNILPLGAFVFGLDVVSGECVDIVGSVADKQLILDLGKKVKE